jgi:hypothetical protein
MFFGLEFDIPPLFKAYKKFIGWDMKIDSIDHISMFLLATYNMIFNSLL